MSLSPLLPTSLLDVLEAKDLLSELWTSFGLGLDPFYTVAPPVKFDPFGDDDKIKLPPKGSPPASPFLPWTTWAAFPSKDAKFPPSRAPTSSPATQYYSSSAPSGSTSECSWPPTPTKTTSPFETIAPRPRMVLDATLQLHFRGTMVAVPRICNPDDIASEASWTCATYMRAKDNKPLRNLVRRIISAGTRREEYSRSTALFTRQLIEQFGEILLDETRTFNERDTAEQRLSFFVRVLDNLVWQEFIAVWSGFEMESDEPAVLVNGLETLERWDETTRRNILHTTAFVADLFAVGALSPTTMSQLLHWVAVRTRTLTHCRALHVMLSRMTMAGLRTVPGPLLEEVREILVANGTYHPLFTNNINACRWLQEIGDLLNKVKEAGSFELACPPLTVHTPHSPIKWDGISEILADRPQILERPKVFSLPVPKTTNGRE